MMLQISVARIYGARVIQCDDLGPGAQGHFGEPTGTTSSIQNPLSADIFGSPTRRFPKTVGGNWIPRVAVELGPAELVPLHAEAIGIVRFGHKAGNEIPN